MAILLGIDTGGTYTDAVLMDEAAPAPGIVAKAKALTTHDDLALGIGAATGRVLAASGIAPGRIGLASVSTTLATNALVEGRGGRVCLILIGFDEGALARAGLGTALGQDPVIFVAGGHDATGTRQAPLDGAALSQAVEHNADAAAFAIVAHFGTRNPEDEIAAREIATTTGRPVTCGHELAAALGGPKRALTSLLNARLIHLIANLIAATEAVLAVHGITAPLMLVRGDGSLVSADFARTRPIETILSGPAASLVGAAHLTGATDAVVSDIGGTTTDIAILRNGRPAIRADGAMVGGHHTMVEAVDMVTHGLGGDSEVAIDEASLSPHLHLGPRRLIPVSLLATEHPATVHAALDADLARPIPGSHDGWFLLRTAPETALAGLGDGERALLGRLGDGPVSAGLALTSRMQVAALNRLTARGLIRVAGFTPSDAAHVAGQHAGWDTTAAEKAARLMARRRNAAGRPVAASAQALAEWTIRTLERRSAELLLDAVLAHDGIAPAGSDALIRAALDGHRGATAIRIGLDLPLIGLGASAPVYYPAIARLLGTTSVIPADADVANAVGAVAGQVRIALAATISQPEEGRFRVHLAEAPGDFPGLDAARTHATEALARTAEAQARAAGAGEIALTSEWEEKTAPVEGRTVFIEGTARVVASGRPRLG